MNLPDSNHLQSFDRLGFALIPNVIGQEEMAQLIQAITQTNPNSTAIRQRGQGTYAMRNLLETVPAVKTLAASTPIRLLVESILGPTAFPVRGLLFDKTPEANWKVAWHQDLSVAVKHRIEVAGFGPWSIKAGIQHVQPPASVLEQMLTVRLHLDDSHEENGPLQVLPGSHIHGKLGAQEIEAWRNQTPATPCIIGQGGVLLMRPLLLHASSPAQRPGHRRVIHLEFAAKSLPGGLEWLATQFA
ncbi:MAG: protein involved in biosynthesis of mitomycin antibiotics/polyketide fumonisin [Pedosphaera sp.]|nr:protein involved in biosynthesis of mitomycin antibiotics/polyketide fumonisin [Pedosphaera sp.]